ncbi:MAG: hypothetical protein WCR19_04965 [Acholeplasmataceae bacterium]
MKKTTYKLNKGTYFIGDPAVVVIKNDDGEAFLQLLWETFYENPNEFQYLNIKGSKFYVTRTEGGDGIFNDIGTDTGIIMIVNIKELKNHKIFKKELPTLRTKIITYDHDSFVCVNDFNIYFEGFEIITN